MNILVVSNRYKDRNMNYGKKVVNEIEAMGTDYICKLILDSQIAMAKYDRYDLIIGIGGDGTVLHLIHAFPKIPVFCFNMGRVGFLAEGDLSNLSEILKDILVRKECKIVENNFIQLELGKNIFKGVNDILVGKYNMLSTIELTLYINDERVKTFICDGILISSGMGSSAYNLSLGGPLIYDGFNVMCINIIGSKDLSFPKIVVPVGSEIKIKVSSRKNKSEVGLLGVDGEYATKVLYGDEEIKFTYSNETYQLLKLKDYTYIQAIKSKIIGKD